MSYKELDGAAFWRVLMAGAAYLERHKEQVNVLNVFPVPDGDTGTNMTLTLNAARRELEGEVPESIGEVAQRVARGVLLGARGNSGVILSQFLRGLALGLAGMRSAGPAELARALAKATETAYRAVIKPVEGTMLTVSKGASDRALRAAAAGADLAGVLEAAVKGAEEALARTPRLLPVLAKAGVVDAGGQGLVFFLTGMLRAVRGEFAAEEPHAAASPQSVVDEVLHGVITHEEVTLPYCTEFLIRGRHIPGDIVRARIGELGDSLLVVGDGDLVKVHVHTDHPGRVLEIALEYGELLDIKIDNMQEQNRRAAEQAARRRGHDDGHAPRPAGPGRETGGGAAAWAAHGESGPAAASVTATANRTRSGVVAVAPGPGWETLLQSLGAARVISGGQTMNPSAAELLEAIEAVEADDVIVMPNNSNIIFAARQARELTSKRVHIVETRSAPQSVAALMAYNPEGDPAAVAAEMAQAAAQLRTVEITYAVRDSNAFAGGIKAGDILAIIDGEIRVVDSDLHSTVLKALEQLLDDGAEAPLISIYYGADVSEDDAHALAERVRARWPQSEVEIFAGGQPVYYYILSVE